MTMMEKVYLAIPLHPSPGPRRRLLRPPDRPRRRALGHHHRCRGVVFLLAGVFKHIVLDGNPSLQRRGLHLAGERRHPLRGRLPGRPLTTLMIMVVTFVSLMVHIYTVGYMRTTTTGGLPALLQPISRCSPSRC
jgi:hypothetical protein